MKFLEIRAGDEEKTRYYGNKAPRAILIETCRILLLFPHFHISRSDFRTNMKYLMENENYAKHEIIWGCTAIFMEDTRHKPCKSQVSGISLPSAILLQHCIKYKIIPTV
jgi:hypothetical protein